MFMYVYVCICMYMQICCPSIILKLFPIIIIPTTTDRQTGGRRVGGNIWCIGAGELSLRPVRVTNAASPYG